MNLQIRIEVPVEAGAPDYQTPTTVQVIDDPETVRAVLASVIFCENNQAERATAKAEFDQARESLSTLTDMVRAARDTDEVEIDLGDLGQ